MEKTSYSYTNHRGESHRHSTDNIDTSGLFECKLKVLPKKGYLRKNKGMEYVTNISLFLSGLLVYICSFMLLKGASDVLLESWFL